MSEGLNAIFSRGGDVTCAIDELQDGSVRIANIRARAVDDGDVWACWTSRCRSLQASPVSAFGPTRRHRTCPRLKRSRRCCAPRRRSLSSTRRAAARSASISPARWPRSAWPTRWRARRCRCPAAIASSWRWRGGGCRRHHLQGRDHHHARPEVRRRPAAPLEDREPFTAGVLKNAKEPDIARAFVATMTAPEAAASGPRWGLSGSGGALTRLLGSEGRLKSAPAP